MTFTAKTNTCLLDLPLELRNEIYCFICEDLFSIAVHPYDPLPEHSRYRDYVSLLLCNRQVSAQCQKLFVKYYAHHMVLYFAAAPDLVNFSAALAEDDPLLMQARFVLRASNVYEDNPAYAHKAHTEQFITSQPGFNADWLDAPGLYVTRIQLWQIGDQNQGFHGDWEPSRHGFERSEGSHEGCSAVQRAKGECRPYVKLVYPRLGNGCTLTTYTWGLQRLQSPTLFYGRVWPACMELEGRIRDVRNMHI